ncbi:hypothetical protein [Kitasatospora sp. NPDC057738]|uniref:hypothetical protein n=1 Tax=Kitasatospora sp. NPDC057738 TaxID=3346233 RepID=UPI00367EE1E9
MPSSWWTGHRARRRIRRELRRIEARLPSSCPGIGFTTRITATVITGPPYPDTSEAIVVAVRTLLRKAAADLSRTCDPTDPGTAQDALEQHLRQRRRLATEPPVEFTATLDLRLSAADQSAVEALLDAQRTQAVADILRRQRTQALAAELADPAAVLARWADQDRADWSKPPHSEAEKLSAVFAQYRPAHERTLDHEVLEVVRDFLASFPHLSQKQVLYSFVAGGMDHADRPQHAAKARELLNGHAAPAPDGET